MQSLTLKIISHSLLTSELLLYNGAALHHLQHSFAFSPVIGGWYFPWRPIRAKFSTRISKAVDRVRKSDILKKGDVQPVAPHTSSFLAEQAEAAFAAWSDEDFPPKLVSRHVVPNVQKRATIGRETTQQSLTLKSTESTKPQIVIQPESAWVYSVPLMSQKKCTPVTTDEIITCGLVVDQEYKSYPSVTHVLNETRSIESAMALDRWRKKKIVELGEEGFNNYMREAKLTGKELHFCLETHFRGVLREDCIGSRVVGHWKSLRALLPYLNHVKVLESSVVHDQLKYRGFVDCVAFYNNTLVVIEWKTSQRNKSDLSATYDDPVQMAAYIGAINQDGNYPFQVDNGLLVVCYATGAPAHVHLLSKSQCEEYWRVWLQRLAVYHKRKNKFALP